MLVGFSTAPDEVVSKVSRASPPTTPDSRRPSSSDSNARRPSLRASLHGAFGEVARRLSLAGGVRAPARSPRAELADVLTAVGRGSFDDAHDARDGAAAGADDTDDDDDEGDDDDDDDHDPAAVARRDEHRLALALGALDARGASAAQRLDGLRRLGALCADDEAAAAGACQAGAIRLVVRALAERPDDAAIQTAGLRWLAALAFVERLAAAAARAGALALARRCAL